MKHQFAWASAVVLAVTFSSQTQTRAITNGVIVMTTRTAADALWREISSSRLYDADDNMGPGIISPGDAAMQALLQDYGYVVRIVPEWLLKPEILDPCGVYTANLGPEVIYNGGGGPSPGAPASNVVFSAMLVIVSGSGSSSDMPPPNTNGIPIIMGEHSCLDDSKPPCDLFMYGNKNNNSNNQAGTNQGPLQYMIVVNTNHPIMQGIPLDSQNRVKIWRDPYPEEDFVHTPVGAKLNYRYSWQFVDISAGKATVAPGTIVLGVEGDNTNRVVFAVTPAGGELSNGDTNHANYVHLFVNEHGSGDSRRAFNALTDIGRVIFIRTCKWAMGETLTPYQPLGLIRVSLVAPQQIQLEWEGTATKNYKVLGIHDLSNATSIANWQTVAQDIPGTNGTVTAKFDISGAVQYAFLRVVPVP